jgi:dethiobiotin synthetase
MRPNQLIVIAGTATDIGKTWVSCRLLERWRSAGITVAARKPAQSFEQAPSGDRAPTDAELLASASGEQAHDVCPAHRWYEVPMAPPMAGAALGRPVITLDDLLSELSWPADVAIGLVETVGGARSPLAEDADSATFSRRLAPDLVLVVADAELGTINSVRSTVDALAPLPVVVLLNRYTAANDMHRRNLDWLAHHDGLNVHTTVDGLILEIATCQPWVDSG